MEEFIFTDIHGDKELFNKIYDWLVERPEYWRCYFLGDACDRGDHGYEIIKILLRDRRFVYLKGNHEDLFVKAAKALKQYWKENGLSKETIIKNPYTNIIEYGWDYDISLHIQNGGLKTLIDWVEDGAPMDIIKELEELPEHLIITNKNNLKIDLSHAGHLVDNSDDFIWSRKHFFEDWNNGLMIHGHTPIRSLRRLVDISTKNTEPAFYRSNTKLCLDTGCFITGYINVLDINTLKLVRFDNF